MICDYILATVFTGSLRWSETHPRLVIGSGCCTLPPPALLVLLIGCCIYTDLSEAPQKVSAWRDYLYYSQDRMIVKYRLLNQQREGDYQEIATHKLRGKSLSKGEPGGSL